MIVYLKDRSKHPTEDERDWYERAFGRKRNIMTCTVRYFPLFDAGRKGHCEFYTKLQYKMYTEMAEEFNPRDYDKYRDILIPMIGEEDENDNWVYRYNLELPYGDWKYSFWFKNKLNDSSEVLELPAAQLETLKARLEPEPISFEQQRILDTQEEEDIKKREHEARME